jgi:hypothetical protein
MRPIGFVLAPLLAAALVVGACSGNPLEPRANSSDAPAILASSGPGSGSKLAGPKQLVYCKPFDEASKTATIGILGGTIKVGPHTLIIPPGALLSQKTITARILKNDYTHSVVFAPEGLKFLVPALVTLSYQGCDYKPTLLQQLEVVYTTDALDRILELLPSINNPLNKTTTGTIRHFSRYAIAY